MDFGIARVLAEETLATTGLLGTAAYLSPEQAAGGPIDARSDLYSLGCVLYAMLTGRPPFAADSPVALAAQHIHAHPQPPSELRTGLDAGIDALVLRALAKDPGDRFQSAAEMREALLAGAHAALAPGGVNPTQTLAAAADAPIATQVMGAAAGIEGVGSALGDRPLGAAAGGGRMGATSVTRRLGRQHGLRRAIRRHQVVASALAALVVLVAAAGAAIGVIGGDSSGNHSVAQPSAHSAAPSPGVTATTPTPAATTPTPTPAASRPGQVPGHPKHKGQKKGQQDKQGGQGN
jgi:serine/threonine-protein kinase